MPWFCWMVNVTSDRGVYLFAGAIVFCGEAKDWSKSNTRHAPTGYLIIGRWELFSLPNLMYQRGSKSKRPESALNAASDWCRLVDKLWHSTEEGLTKRVTKKRFLLRWIWNYFFSRGWERSSLLSLPTLPLKGKGIFWTLIWLSCVQLDFLYGWCLGQRNRFREYALEKKWKQVQGIDAGFFRLFY